MPVYDPKFTADKAAADLQARIPEANIAGGSSAITPYMDATRKGRKGRVAPPELSMVQEFKRKLVHVFNCGPWPHIVPCGSIGTFVIPPCPINDPKIKFVQMTTPLHQIEDELVISSEKEYKRLQDEGRHIAMEIIGEGRGRNHRDSLRHFGVFLADGDVPTEKEIEDATAQVHAKCMEYVEQIRNLWDLDRKLAYDVKNPKIHIVAAQVLNLTNEKWMLESTPSNNIKCPACRVSVEPDAPICFNCKNVVNQEAFLALKAQQDSIAAATAPSKGK